jgi:hypothetical protein
MSKEPKKLWPSVTVTENGRTIEAFYPPTEDRQEAHDLREMAIDKTRADLKKKPPKFVPTAEDREKASEFLRENHEYQERKRSDHPRKYF